MTAPAANVAAWLLEVGADDAIAIIDRDRAVSYGELRQSVRCVAAYVKERTAGLPLPIVPILGENTIDLVIAYLATIYAGAIPAPLPPLGPVNRGAVLEETAAPFVFFTRELDAATRDSLSGTGVTVDDVLAMHPSPIAPVDVDSSRMVLLLYTSGSTGRPRGVMISSRNLFANTTAILELLPLSASDRAFVTLPLYYCFGASVLHTHLRAGASVFFTRETFPENLLAHVASSEATVLPGVPSLFSILLLRASIANVPLPFLRHIMVSGGRLAEASLCALADAVPAARIYVRYGVTELTAAASYVPPQMMRAKMGSIGRGLPRQELFVVDERGEPVAPGSGVVGQIVARGEHVTAGYFRDAEATAASFRDGGFLTGDLATVDEDGFIFIVGREKEFIKTGGHRVAPQEVEAVIAQVSGVNEVAVYGIPHPVRGEALVAAIVVAEREAPTMREVKHHCVAHLEPFKVPVQFTVVSTLPRTPNGKLDRRLLSSTVRLTAEERGPGG